MTLPGNERTYFCADMSDRGALSYQPRRGSCRSSESAPRRRQPLFVVNHAPRALELGSASVLEAQPAGTAVGALSATDADGGDRLVFSLVPGTGDGDNAAFRVSGDALETNELFDYESRGSYAVRVRAADEWGLWVERSFTVTVGDVNERPTNVSLEPASVPENALPGTLVGTFAAADPESGEGVTFSLVPGTTDNDYFRIVGSTLVTSSYFDSAQKDAFGVHVRATDRGGLSFDRVLTVRISPVGREPALSIGDVSLAEGNLGVSLASFTVTLSRAVRFAVPVRYGTADGTATAGVDYEAAAGTIVFTPGETSKQVTVLVVGDTVVEPDETFFVDVAPLANASLARGRAQGTIVNDDSPPATPSLSIDDVQVSEGSSGTTNAVFTISLSPASPQAVTVHYATADGTATAGSDYQAAIGTVTFAPGETTKQVPVVVNGDTFVEAGETFFVDLSNPAGATLADAQGKATILNDDANHAPSDVALSNTSVAENQPAGTTVGTLSTSDPDAGDSFTYSLVSGAGSTDNASFQIVGAALQTNAVFDFEAKASYSIRVRTTDAGLLAFEKVFTITVTNVNDAPTDVALSNASVAENQPAGTTVGALSAADPDAGQTHTFSLVAGAGDADNGSFQIVGATLQTNAVFDFEAKASYSIRVQAIDNGLPAQTFEKVFTITVTNVNEAPSDIVLSNTSVAENQPVGTTVGTLSATDSDAGQTHTFSLVAGAGDTDNGSFQIAGATLQTNAVFDFETKASYSIRVQATDSGVPAQTFEKVFTITVTNADEAPSDVALSSASVAENEPVGTGVGTLSTTDPDPGDTFTYSLVSGAGSTDNASFQIVGAALQTNAVFDFEAKASYSIRVRSTDSGSLTFEKAFTITVTNVNEAPTDVALSNASVAENQPAGTTVGTLSATDPDAGQTHTFNLVTGAGDTDNGSFQIVGTTLQTNAVFDFEAKASYSIRVRATDNGLPAQSFEKVFAITVTNANEAPGDIALSNTSVAENQPAGTTVGTLSATDPDAGQTHTFSLVAGAGGTDNASFQIVGATLQTNAVFDFETKASYSIRVRATDNGLPAQSFEKVFTITVTNVNEAPSDVALSSASVAENQPAGTTVGTLSTSDPDAGDSFTYSLVSGAGSTDNASFQVVGAALQTTAVFDFEAKSSYSIRVRSTDGGSLFVEKAFTISVTDVNEAPTDIALSNSSIDENQPSGTTIGSLSATDPDSGQTHSFSLQSSGCGGSFPDNGSFSIAGTSLRSAVSFNFEAKSSYTICVRTTDNGTPSLSLDKQLTITINDVNDPPVANADSYSGAIGNTLAVVQTTGSGPNVALTGNVLTANDTDEDATFPHTLTAVAETNSSTGGGTATINSDGSFTFLPGVGDKNQNDTFTYHVTDGTATTAGTVTIHIDDFLVWYANNALGSNGDGRSSSPFNTLGSLNGAGGSGDSDGTGDYIFLYQGSGNYTGGLPLEASQKLVGQPQGLVVNGDTLVAAGGSNPTLTNSGGAGLTLADGNTIQRVNVTGASGAGVTGSGIGTLTYGATTTISGNGGGGLILSGAAGGAISVGADIATSAGHSVSIANRSSGTTSLTGAITDTGTGISLSSNTGATITFSGGVTASTGANAAFTATGGGTVNATQNNSTIVNTLNTTSGTALNVTNTTIGASGLTFRSVSSNGGANGIVLNSTGATGGLTVTGNGGTCTSTGSSCTGGTIQSTTGHAISLTSTQSPSFTFMKITNIAGSGIYGTSVTNFALANSVIDGVNTAHNGSDANIAFNQNGGGATENNVSGAVSITNSFLNNSYQAGIDIQNYSGTISNLTITGDSFTSNTSNTLSFGSAINVVANRSTSNHASITSGSLSGNTIQNFPSGAGIQVIGGNSGAGQAVAIASLGSPLLIQDNTITGAGAGSSGLGTNGIAVTAGESTTAYFTIGQSGHPNTITNVRGNGVACSLFGNGTEKCSIAFNTINANNTAGSPGINTGADQSSASGSSGNGTLYLDIHDNTVSNTTGNGILSTLRSVSSTGSFHIENNNVGQPTVASGTVYGIRADSGNGTGSPNLCLKISGNTTAGSTNGVLTAPGIGLRQSHADPGGGTGTFRIDGLTPSPANDALMQAYVGNLGQNPNSANGTFGVTGVASISAGATFTAGTCTIP